MDNTVKILDINTNTWTQRPQRRDAPSSNVRLGHTAVIRDRKAYIFGGEQEDRAFSNSLHCYDLDTDSWSLPESADSDDSIPLERSRHAACLTPDGSKMIITGGLTQEKEVLSDIFCYSFESGTWSGPMEFVARYDHFVTIYNNRLWAFGGLTPNMDLVSEVAWYDFETEAIGHINITSNDDSLLNRNGTVGNHFYSSGVNGTVVDVICPGPTNRHRVDSSISALDLDTLKWRSIICGCDNYMQGFVWYHMVTLKTRLVLLGQSLESLEQHDEERLSDMMTINLAEFGYLDSSPEPSDHVSASGTISHDMYEFFKRSELCDFEITAVEGDERPDLFHTPVERRLSISKQSSSSSETSLGKPQHPNFLSKPSVSSFSDIETSTPSLLSIDDNQSSVTTASELFSHYAVSEPIKVHMMVLFARWPHFKRIITSQMAEYHTRKLYIPEPVAWVRKLVEFMYRDSISGCNIEEASGLLILANLYELPRLRKLCLESVSRQGINDSNAVMLWDRAKIAGEEVLQRNAAVHCLRHWGRIVRSPSFAKLSKEFIVELCSEADVDSMIWVPPERIRLQEIDRKIQENSSVIGEDDPITDAYEEYDDDMDI